jgi:hypothetical protein
MTGGFLMRGSLFLTFSILMASFLLNCQSTSRENSGDRSSVMALSSSSMFKLTDQKMFDLSVHEISVNVDGDTFLQMTNLPAQGGYSCRDDVPYGHIKDFSFKNVRTSETITINNAGMRVKGNTSCDDPINERGFKFKMNPVDKFSASGQRTQKIYEKFGAVLNYPQDLANKIKGQNLHGMEEFAIRRSGVDPSHIRDLIASDVFEYGGELARKYGAPGAPIQGGPVYRGSVAYVKVYSGFGVLAEGHAALVELVDGELIKSHYGKEALGHLFKIKEAKGTFLDADMPTNDNRRLLTIYEPKTIDGDGYDPTNGNQAKRAAEILLGFKKSLNEAIASSDRNERRNRLSNFLDVDNILTIWCL